MSKPKPDPTREKAWRRHLRTTREGKAFIFVTFGVGLAAFNTGSNLLFLVFGFMLSLIVLSGILSENSIRNVRVIRRLPQRANAQSTCLVEVLLHNEKERIASYSLEVEDIAESTPTERRCYFLKVAPRSQQIATYRRTPARRGVLRFNGFRIATRYPFGIFEKWRLLHEPGEMIVFPALLAAHEVAGELRHHGVDAPSGQTGPGTEIAGLRSFVTGDEARNVHWRRTAALGRLVVREHERDNSTQLTIVLDNARPAASDSAWDERFEHLVSRAATLATHAAAAQMSVEVVARGSRSPLALAGSALEPVLRYLALIEAVAAELAPPIGSVYGRGMQISLQVTAEAASTETSRRVTTEIKVA